MRVDAPNFFRSYGTAVVIDDDLDIQTAVVEMLRQAGFDVHAGTTGLDGVEAVRASTPCVVTLNVDLPDIDGYEVLRRIRETSDCYVIMLSARIDEHDTLTALQLGADDFIYKPFRPRELRARIEAMLRRPRDGSRKLTEITSPSVLPALAPQQSVLFRRGKLTLDCGTRTVRIATKEMALTKSEFDLLYEMLRSDGAVRTKSALARVVRGEEYRGYSYVSGAEERAIEVHMGNLRRKLSQRLGHDELIKTIRGVGYRVALSAETE
ncbi:response regulator transcription factor [Arthrobacter sp. TMN-50]